MAEEEVDTKGMNSSINLIYLNFVLIFAAAIVSFSYMFFTFLSVS